MKGGKVGKTGVTGTVAGVDVTASDKIWKSFQATGDIAFSYAYSSILVEIQACILSSIDVLGVIIKIVWQFIIIIIIAFYLHLSFKII